MFIFKKSVSVKLNYFELLKARRGINKAICGHEECNVPVDGGFELADWVTPEMEVKLLDADRSLCRSHEVELEVSIDENGKFSFKLP